MRLTTCGQEWGVHTRPPLVHGPQHSIVFVSHIFVSHISREHSGIPSVNNGNTATKVMWRVARAAEVGHSLAWHVHSGIKLRGIFGWGTILDRAASVCPRQSVPTSTLPPSHPARTTSAVLKMSYWPYLVPVPGEIACGQCIRQRFLCSACTSDYSNAWNALESNVTYEGRSLLFVIDDRPLKSLWLRTG